jgi:VIT1/CCC1 family predicted Fe2+/Mn2+ transporter
MVQELHYVHRIGVMRAAVLGANDGIVSTASLVIGIAAAGAATGEVVLAGVAGLAAGAMSMAAGEYVSVSSQADIERADLQRERHELEHNEEYELAELTGIYVERGLPSDLAYQVAVELTAHDALGAHARDELGLVEMHSARPLQAALTSALTFAIGAALPLLLVLVAPDTKLELSVAGGSLVCLTAMGALAAHAGGARVLRGALRMTLWGALAMGATAAVGLSFGAIA